MLYINKKIEENLSDSIIMQLSPNAECFNDGTTVLYYDDLYNYLFVYKDYLKPIDLGFEVMLSHPINHPQLIQLLKCRQTILFMEDDDENDQGFHVFMGIYSIPKGLNSLPANNSIVYLKLESETANLTIHVQKPNYVLDVIDPVEGYSVYHHNFFSNIEHDAKKLAYEEVLKCALEDGEYCTKLYRIWPDNSKHDVPGMPSIELIVFNGKVKITTLNPFQ